MTDTVNPTNQDKLRRRIGVAGEAQIEQRAYVTATRDRRPLRFTKSGEKNLERAYRTHWVAAKPRRASADIAKPITHQGEAPAP